MGYLESVRLRKMQFFSIGKKYDGASINESSRIGFASFLCALEIAMFHAPCMWATLSPRAEILYQLSCPMTQAALAFFFAISGYFVAGKVNSLEAYIHVVIKRVRTLFVPFVIWNLIFFCCVSLMFVVLATQGNCSEFSSLMPSGGSRWLHPSVMSFIRNCPNPTLWFLRALLVLIVISPVLSVGVRLFSFVFPVVLGLICVLLEIFHMSLPFSMLFQPRAIFYFTLGLWWKTNNREWPVSRVWSALLSFVGYVISFKFSFGYLLLMVGYIGLVPSVSCGRTLQSYAFPLYMIHYLMIWLFLFLNAIFSFVSTGTVSWIVASGLFGIVLSMFTIVVLRRCSTLVCNVLFGGR